MLDIFLLLTCILITCAIGGGVVYLLCGRRGFREIAIIEKIGLSYLFGFGILTIQMFITGFLGISLTRMSVLVPWVLIFIGIAIYTRLRPLEDTTSNTDEKRSPLKTMDITLICLIVFQTIYNFFRALIKPMEAYDSVAIWALKAKVIYLNNGISSNFFKDFLLNFHGKAHPDYPLLLPLSEAWVYTFLGKFNDLIVKAIFPLFFLSFLLVFYSAVKRITKSRSVSLLFTFLLASIKQFSDYSTIGYSDMEVGMYFAISLFFLYFWFTNREERFFLNMSLFSSVLCLWTKKEGMLLSSIVVFVFLVFTLTNIRKIKKEDILRFFIYALIVLSLIFFWNIFVSSQGMLNRNFNLSMVSLKSLTENLSKIPTILYEYQKQLFGFKKWNMVWLLFLFTFIRYFKEAFSDNIKYVTYAFFLFIAGYTSIYIFSAVPIDYFVRTTGSRFLLHVLPVALLWVVVILNKKGIFLSWEK